jgi:hypothetical protein
VYTISLETPFEILRCTLLWFIWVRNVILNLGTNPSTKEFLFSVLGKPRCRWAWAELKRFVQVRSQEKQ